MRLPHGALLASGLSLGSAWIWEDWIDFDDVEEDALNSSETAGSSHAGRQKCGSDQDCPLSSPLCDRGRYRCKDIWNFNASMGRCICGPGCEPEEIQVDATERRNVSECHYQCKQRSECKGFQGSYDAQKNFSCTLYRISGSDDDMLLDGDRMIGGIYCFHRVAPERKCHHHLAYRAMESGLDLCCPDREGEMLGCCHYQHGIQVGGYVTASLVLLLALSMYCNCRTCGKSDVATSASDMPGRQDVRFPSTSTSPGADAPVDPMGTRRFILAFVNSGSGDQSGENFQKVFRRYLGAQTTGRVCKLPDDLEDGFEEAASQLKKNNEVAILACGGDGTVTWILSELNARKSTTFDQLMMPSVGIIPLGTGNDLARSLGWGPALTDTSDLPKYIQRARCAGKVLLDQWKLVLRPTHLLPRSLQQEGTVAFIGYFTNYFSVGMDAATAFEVAKVRSSRFGQCCFRTRCIPPCQFIHGGLLCYGMNAPNCLRCLCCRTRPLNKDDLEVKLDGEDFRFDGPIRQFTLTNLNSYGAGMMLYGSNEHVSPNDGKLEVFTREGPYGVVSMTLNKKLLQTSCCDIPVLHQPKKVEMKLKRGQYFQMDGEPWVLNAPCTATVERHTRVSMLCPNTDGAGPGEWSGCQKRHFWERVDTGLHGEQELSPFAVAAVARDAASSV